MRQHPTCRPPVRRPRRVGIGNVLAQPGPSDIVLDDGGHAMRQPIVSFETIYPTKGHARRLLAGVYMVSDSVTSPWGGSPADTLDGSAFLDVG